MRELNEVLTGFAESIVRGNEPAPAVIASYPNYSRAAAIEVYRNNYFGNLIDALAGAYPVVLQLVGADFFRFLARRFIAANPSTSGNLHRYGAGLSDFLAEFEPARGLAYLPDMARLEWACHLAYFAPEPGVFDLGKLAAIPPERYPELILHPHPATHLVRSCHPVTAIWRAHRPGAPDDFDVELGRGGNALVSRKEGGVAVDELSDRDSHWLQMILDGNPLGIATEATLEHHPEFDLQFLLARLIEKRALFDFSLGAEP